MRARVRVLGLVVGSVRDVRWARGAEHDFEHHVSALVCAAREELERTSGVREAEAVRDERADVGHLARPKQRERRWVRVGVTERALDIDLAKRRSRERQCGVARAHPDEHHLPACDCGLNGRYEHTER